MKNIFNVNNTWFTSDLHFWHKNICKYCNRPYADVELMNEAIVANWNGVVQPYDDVIILGDLGFCGYEKLSDLISRLNGRKYLIQGNHDSDKIVKRLKENYLIADCERLQTIKMIGDEEIPEQELVLCHFPILDWDNKTKGSWMIHGHQHQLPDTPSCSQKHYDVGVDKNNWTPINFDTIKIKITKQLLYENTYISL